MENFVIEKKLCATCKIQKSVIEFGKIKDGYRRECKACRRICFWKKKGQEPPKIEIPPIEVKNKTHKICTTCKTIKTIDNFNKNRSNTCKSCQKIKFKEYYIKNQERLSQKYKKYYQETKEKQKLRKQKYLNSEQGKQKTKQYKSQLQVKIRGRLRAQLRRAVLDYNMDKKLYTLDYLGCDLIYFIGWIKCQFDENMSEKLWNQGLIHIDHKKPLCSFDLTKDEEIKKAFHYTNLRPLLGPDNYSKASDDKKMSIN